MSHGAGQGAGRGGVVGQAAAAWPEFVRSQATAFGGMKDAQLPALPGYLESAMGQGPGGGGQGGGFGAGAAAALPEARPPMPQLPPPLPPSGISNTTDRGGVPRVFTPTSGTGTAPYPPPPTATAPNITISINGQPAAPAATASGSVADMPQAQYLESASGRTCRGSSGARPQIDAVGHQPRRGRSGLAESDGRVAARTGWRRRRGVRLMSTDAPPCSRLALPATLRGDGPAGTASGQARSRGRSAAWKNSPEASPSPRPRPRRRRKHPPRQLPRRRLRRPKGAASPSGSRPPVRPPSPRVRPPLRQAQCKLRRPPTLLLRRLRPQLWRQLSLRTCHPTTTSRIPPYRS